MSDYEKAVEELVKATREMVSSCYGFREGVLHVEYEQVTKTRAALTRLACADVDRKAT